MAACPEQPTGSAVPPAFPALDGRPDQRVSLLLGDGRTVAEAKAQPNPIAETSRLLLPSLRFYHLYYTSRRQLTPAFALLVDALRYHG